MVCHHLPPPFPEHHDVIVAIVAHINEYQPLNYEPTYDYQVRDFVSTYGFTMVGRVGFQSFRLSYHGYIVRTLEEGWVILDNWYQGKRWKRLGWHDSHTKNDWTAARVAALELIGVLEKGDDWLVGLEGWRYGEVRSAADENPQFCIRILSSEPLFSTNRNQLCEMLDVNTQDANTLAICGAAPRLVFRTLIATIQKYPKRAKISIPSASKITVQLLFGALGFTPTGPVPGTLNYEIQNFDHAVYPDTNRWVDIGSIAEVWQESIGEAEVRRLYSLIKLIPMTPETKVMLGATVLITVAVYIVLCHPDLGKQIQNRILEEFKRLFKDITWMVIEAGVNFHLWINYIEASGVVEKVRSAGASAVGVVASGSSVVYSHLAPLKSKL